MYKQKNSVTRMQTISTPSNSKHIRYHPCLPSVTSPHNPSRRAIAVLNKALTSFFNSPRYFHSKSARSCVQLRGDLGTVRVLPLVSLAELRFDLDPFILLPITPLPPLAGRGIGSLVATDDGAPGLLTVAPCLALAGVDAGIVAVGLAPLTAALVGGGGPLVGG